MRGTRSVLVLKESQELLRLRVACDKTAAAVVRAAVSQIDPNNWVLGDTMLVASELVTNVFRHAEGGAGHVIDVEVRREPSAISISVRDPHPSESAGALRPPPTPPAAGLGLAIVDALAHRWGTDRDQGYHVWAEIAVV